MTIRVKELTVHSFHAHSQEVTIRGDIVFDTSDSVAVQRVQDAVNAALPAQSTDSGARRILLAE
jgi:hypothetical protein